MQREDGQSERTTKVRRLVRTSRLKLKLTQPDFTALKKKKEGLMHRHKKNILVIHIERVEQRPQTHRLS